MTKHCGPALAFSKEWFQRHQSALLWLLNAPLVRIWFRWVLRILPCDCPRSTPIREIGPHYFVVRVGTDEYRADFRTHPKYAKRLYWAFRPLWWMLHVWDLLADSRLPALSFGFSTLTAYPDARSPGTTTCDGSVYRDGVDEAFSSLRSYASGSTYSDQTSTTGPIARLGASTTTGNFQNLYRGLFLFDTSSLTSEANVTAAVLSLYGYSKWNGLGSETLAIVSSSPSSNTLLAATDYSNLGSTSFGSVSYSSYSTSAYNDISLNASGVSNVSKTGVSKFGTRGEWDRGGTFSGTWVSGDQSSFGAYFADQSGTSQDPKLVITYTTTVSKVLTVAQSSTRSVSRIVARKRTLSVAQASVSDLVKTAHRLLSLVVSQASSVSLTSVQAIILSVATTTVASIAAGYEKLLAVAQSSTVTLTRGLSWALSVAQTSSATLAATRFYTQLLSVVTSTVATLQTGLFYPVEMFVWQETTAVMTAIRGRVLAVTQASTATFTRSVGKVLSVSQSVLARLAGLSPAGNIGMLPQLPAKVLRVMNWLKRS